jgi:uncharacterized membrane protein
MKESLTRRIVIAGVMAAISIFLGVTRLGFIPWFAGASLTIMHVPVIIAAILAGPGAGLAVGLLFGVASLVQAAVAPNGPADAWFTNPLISVLPRLAIGPLSWLVHRLLQRARVLALAAAGVAGSLTNTVLVLGVLALYRYLPWALAGTIALTNGVLEAVAAAVITLAVVAAWQGVEYGRRGSRLE